MNFINNQINNIRQFNWNSLPKIGMNQINKVRQFNWGSLLAKGGDQLSNLRQYNWRAGLANCTSKVDLKDRNTQIAIVVGGIAAILLITCSRSNKPKKQLTKCKEIEI